MKFIFLLLLLGAALFLNAAEKEQKGRRSLIDSDPEVIYVSDLLTDQEVKLTVTAPAHVYATKNGGRKLGFLKEGKVKLIGFDDRACKVQGQGKIGWIKPSLLASDKGNIQELLKTVYKREIEVQKLIESGEVALGMSREEVCEVLGEPTKQTLRRTKDGVSGSLEFIESEEVRHFIPISDPYTGAIFQRYTHSTQEEKSKVVVEFEEGVVSAIEESAQKNGGKVKVVVRPVVWIW